MIKNDDEPSFSMVSIYIYPTMMIISKPEIRAEYKQHLLFPVNFHEFIKPLINLSLSLGKGYIFPNFYF